MEVETLSIMQGLELFTDENAFANEKEFIDNFCEKKLCSLISMIYGLEVDHYEAEKVFDLKEYDLPFIRVDLFVTTKEGVSFIIECKNPNHKSRELNNTVGQMAAYKLVAEHLKGDVRLILATSKMHFYIIKMMKRFAIEFDIILSNKNFTTYLTYDEINREKTEKQHG